MRLSVRPGARIVPRARDEPLDNIMMSRRFPSFYLTVFALACATTAARAADGSMPHFEQSGGRHAFIVDGQPFLMLGGQCGNSSAWPAELPGVWAAIDRMHANTLEAPVYWEQFEPEPGSFDTTIVDTMIAQAREHHVRLVLLWFGTWKNGSAHYLPLWMKAKPDIYPKVTGRNGPAGGYPVAPLSRDARGGHPGISRADAPPEGGRLPSHGYHGPGGE